MTSPHIQKYRNEPPKWNSSPLDILQNWMCHQLRNWMIRFRSSKPIFNNFIFTPPSLLPDCFYPYPQYLRLQNWPQITQLIISRQSFCPHLTWHNFSNFPQILLVKVMQATQFLYTEHNLHTQTFYNFYDYLGFDNISRVKNYVEFISKMYVFINEKILFSQGKMRNTKICEYVCSLHVRWYPITRCLPNSLTYSNT